MTRMSPQRRAYERAAVINALLWVGIVFVVPILVGKVLW